MNSATFRSTIFPHHKMMYRAAFGIVGNQQDAEDIVQETLLKIWNRRHLLSEIDNFQAYCLVAVKRQSIDFLRKQHSETILINDDALKMQTPESADFHIERKENLKKMKRLLSSLPENLRQVMMLRAYSECSTQEIEKITGLSSANVRTMLSRARKKIKERLENEKR